METELDCKVSVWTLWHFYKWNQVNYRTGQAVYRQFIDKSEHMLRQRGHFSRLMANLMVARADDLIFVDETTYSTVQLKSKSWSHQENVVLHQKMGK